MHALNKVGTTIVAGGLAGLFASAAMGTTTQVATGDYGDFSQAAPNGTSDRISVTAGGLVELAYVNADGLTVQDTAGTVAVVNVNSSGGAYGSRFEVGGPTFGHLTGLDSAQPGWWAEGVVEAVGNTNGSGARFGYRVDGPTAPGGSAYNYFGEYTPGGLSYAGVNSVAITNGGTGNIPGEANGAGGDALADVANEPNALTITITNAGAGQFGWTTDAGAATTPSTALVPLWVDGGAPLADSGRVSNAAYNGADTPTDVLYIVGDLAVIADRGDLGNWRRFLGATPLDINGAPIANAADTAGQIANLDIVVNSTSGGEPVSGIGYVAGNFDIRDSAGNSVDVDIAYQVDSEGRVYCNALGSAAGAVDAATGSAAFDGGGLDYANGWSLPVDKGNFNSSAGWTVTPQGNGSGFECRGVHLYGQLISLAPASTGGVAGIDTVPVMTLEAVAGGTGTVGSGDAAPAFSYDDLYTGAINEAIILAAGTNYNEVPGCIPNADDTAAGGAGGTFIAELGGFGLRLVADADGTAYEVALAELGFDCYPNGDFNGDGFSDFVWRSQEYQTCAIWNMGQDARVISSGLLADPGIDWELVTIGKMGYEGTGCCLFWYNTLTGQTAVWAVNSSDADPSNWLVGGNFLPTVGALTYTPRCGNNTVQNGGNACYWQDSAAGTVAYWPIAVGANASAATLGGGAGTITLNGADVSVPDDSGYNVAAAGCIAGGPVDAGTSVLRDLCLTGSAGDTALWLMNADYTSIGTGGYTNVGGTRTVGNFYLLAGIGQYTDDVVYVSPSAAGAFPGGTRRLQWFAGFNWSLVDVAGFAWRMDRQLNQYDDAGGAGPLTGTGLPSNPFGISGATAVQ